MKLLKIGFSILFFSQILLAQSIACAKLALRIGSVEIGPPKKTINIGSKLSAGTSIRTGKDSFAKLILADRSLIDIGPETIFKLVQCQSSSDRIEIDLELELGGIRANVVPTSKKRKFELKTPTSLLGVRGTEFFVSWVKNSSGQVFEQVGVSRGEVLVAKLLEKQITPTVLRTGTELRSRGKEGGAFESKIDQFSAGEQRSLEQKTRATEELAFETLKQELHQDKKKVSKEEVALEIVQSRNMENRKLASSERKSRKNERSDEKDNVPLAPPGSEGARTQSNNQNSTTIANFQDYIPVLVRWSVKQGEK